MKTLTIDNMQLNVIEFINNARQRHLSFYVELNPRVEELVIGRYYNIKANINDQLITNIVEIKNITKMKGMNCYRLWFK